MPTINVVLNPLGMPLGPEYIDKLYDGGDHSGEIEYTMIRHVLDLPPQHVPRQVIERYVSVSTAETYIGIFPHTDKLFERFLSPLKSAKRTYCLGEYLACIELSAHLGEMLALLLWQITPVTLNGKPMEEVDERRMWGSTFEKLGQEKRVDILRAFLAVSPEIAQGLDYLRATRRKYFHFWSTSTDALPDDARQSFLRVLALVRGILQIEYDNGSVKLNPLLAAYLEKHKSGSVG